MAAILRKEKDYLRMIRGDNNHYSPHIRIWRIPRHGMPSDIGGNSPAWPSAPEYPGKEDVNSAVNRRGWEGLSEEAFEKLHASSMRA